MGQEVYLKAYKMGKKAYQTRLLRGERPTLEVLDEILPPKSEYSEVPLGLIQIPADRIVGTKSDGRSNAFASNFMPILAVRSEFAAKWSNLSSSHVEEGIREPVKAYEYLNKYYVEEGNKRVSVLKYYQADTIAGVVTRILPKRRNDNKLYFEYLDFYDKTNINFIWFSKSGDFQKMLIAVKGNAQDEWDDDDRLYFRSSYYRFQDEYKAAGGSHLRITEGDAFLGFVQLFGYERIKEMTVAEMKELVVKSWKEFCLLDSGNEVRLKMDPQEEKKPLFSVKLTTPRPALKIAFIYAKTPISSAWTYMHELGRNHLEQTFPEEAVTTCFENVTEAIIDDVLETAIKQGNQIIFTTSPIFANASVKAAISHPEIRILNCSLNTSHKYIRTYYTRLHEAKFLMGAIAGAMAENDKISYVEDYPIFGSIANINAFALGAKMVNPRAQVYLDWNSQKDNNVGENIQRRNPSCISAKDIVIPEEESRWYGLFHMADGNRINLAMPLVHWGKFYEDLIRMKVNGTWKDEDKNEAKAINYWWGMSSGVVDIICSKNLPHGTKRLVEWMKKSIISGEMNPFAGKLYSQNGIVQWDPDSVLSPEDVMTMDWLAENVVGSIPKQKELLEHAEGVVRQQGVASSKEG
ncbi:MAG: BMP family ABC transporter substrate-binding protein [Blautia sp.]|nr:BMP family ABC transporter substrate-binding protein [Blautia sp.]